MSRADDLYKQTCLDILNNGFSDENLEVRPHWADGTPAHTIKKFGVVNRYDLSKEFPALTLRRTAIKSATDEILWIWQKKSNNIHDLHSHIWDEWADEEGNLGPVYGAQWRHWRCEDGTEIDQIANLMNQLRNNPDSRRLIVSAWNVAQVDKMALPPCHSLFQFYVVNNKLSCQLYQRSADLFLGVPFNIASYALLTMMIAKVCGFELGDFVHTFGDVHIYNNHREQVALQLTREPRELPKMIIHGNQRDIFDFKYEDFELVGYNPYPAIKAPVAV